MASNDLDKIKRNVSKMVSMNAPEADIDAYLQSEGVTVEQVRNHKVSGGKVPQMGLRAAQNITGMGGTSAFQFGNIEVPELMKDLAAEIPTIVGGTIGAAKGGAIGGGVGGPPGAGIGAVLGAILGSMGGEAVQIGGEALAGSDKTPKTFKEGAIRVGKEGAVAGLAEGGGRIAIKILGKAIAPMKSKIIQRVAELEPELNRFGGEFTVAQRTDNAIFDTLENMVESAPFGRSKMMKVKEGGIKAWDQMGEEFANNLGKYSSDLEVGNVLYDAGKAGREAHREMASKLYDVAGSYFPEDVATIPLKETKDLVAKEAKRLATLQKPPRSSGFSSVLEWLGRQPDVIDYETAKAIRSEILDQRRALKGVVGEDKLKAFLGGIYDAVDGDMGTAAKKISPDAYVAWRRANRFYRYGKETFENKTLAKLFVQEKIAPERVSEYLLRNGNVTEVRQIKKAMRTASNLSKKFTYDDVWGQVRRNHFENILTKQTKGSTDLLNPAGLVKYLKNNNRTLREIYSPEQLKGMMDWAETGRIILSKQQGGGGMVMQLAQGGALLGAATGKFKKGVASVFLSPYLVATMLTNPKTARLLSYGFKLPANSPLVGGFLARLSTEVARIEKEQRKEKMVGRNVVPPSLGSMAK